MTKSRLRLVAATTENLTVAVSGQVVPLRILPFGSPWRS